ncbi:hypothetical protein MY5147_005106 [Beauveria neobassiana]
MDVLVFVIVLSSNVIVVLLPTFFPGWREIQKRSALSALVNIVPLSFGGRDVLIDALNMPRRWHRSLHIIVGIIVALEAASHATIAIVLRPRPGQLAKSGYIASGLLGGVVLLARLIVVCCGYDKPRVGFEPFPTSAYWMCLDPNGGMPFDQLIVSKIKEERCRLPGRMAVVVCGGSKFKRLIRSAVLECLGEELVRYVESAYQPRELAGPEAMHVGRSGAAQLREIPTISRPRKTYSIASASSLYSNK